jgi:riboflavin biosynthesis pyrimidine reductase
MYVADNEHPSLEQLLALYPVAEPSVLRANMVISLDGKIAIDGRSKGLSTDLDRRIFHFLRATSQVILVGAGTARVENYQAPRLDPELARLRHRLGLVRPLRIVVASHHLKPIDTPIHPSAPSSGNGSSSELEYLNLPTTLRRDELERLLQTDQHHPGGVLCEGGPTLLSNLLEQNLVDEFCLTVRHLIAGSSSKSVVTDALTTPVDFKLAASLSTRDATFLRLSRPS